jgi:hypothetical protein
VFSVFRRRVVRDGARKLARRCTRHDRLGRMNEA